MTLIAAWRCADGAVIHADTQETVTLPTGVDTFGRETSEQYRVTVQKIIPTDMGNYKVVLAGSGNGRLIDSFGIVLSRRLGRSHDDSMSYFEAAFEDELIKFIKRDVRLCQDADKDMTFIVSACSPTSNEYDVWVTDNIRLDRVKEVRLVGWDHALYGNIADRFYTPEMTTAKAVIAGIYLFGIAEETSNSIRGPLSIDVVTKDHIWQEKEPYIQLVRDRLKEYEKEVNHLFLDCTDTSIRPDQLDVKLDSFKDYASALHLKQVKTVIEEFMTSGQKEGRTETKHPYWRIPEGTHSYSTGKGDTIVSFKKQGERTSTGEPEQDPETK